METIKIAIVDDHKMLSGAIEKMLSINKKYKVLEKTRTFFLSQKSCNFNLLSTLI